jgi:hypothetical protein
MPQNGIPCSKSLKFYMKLKLFCTILNCVCLSIIIEFETKRSLAAHRNPWKVSLLQHDMIEWENAIAPLD